MELLEKAIKATVIQCWLIAAFTCLATLGLLAASLFQLVSGAALGGAAFIAFLALIMAGTTWAMASIARENSPVQQSPIYLAFLAQPAQVAWVYQKVGKAAGFRVELMDGTGLTLAAGRKDMEALFDLTRQRAPGAIIGWGKQQEAAWRQKLRGEAAA